MKKTVISYLLLLISCAGIATNTFAKATSTTKSHEQSLDKIMALVNDDVITQIEFKHALEKARAQIRQEEVTPPPETVLTKQVLDQLINRKIQLQIAKQTGVQTTDKELDDTISKIAGQNHITTSSLYQHVVQEGMTRNEYRQEIRDQMTMQKLQQQEVVGKINVTPEDVSRFLASKVWQNNNTKEYHLEDVLVPVSDKPSAQEMANAKTRAQTIIMQLNQGQSLGNLIQASSTEIQPLQGGDLGWRKLPEIPAIFAEKVVQMKPNDFAGPIQAPNGFHIIHLVESRKNTTKQATPTHKQVEEMLMQRKFEEAVQNWVSRLRGQAYVQIEKQ
jgi:peptidyl-prolyl cis-trans isomerase SurA